MELRTFVIVLKKLYMIHFKYGQDKYSGKLGSSFHPKVNSYNDVPMHLSLLIIQTVDSIPSRLAG